VAIFVRGVGAVTPLGRSWPQTCAALAEGKSAVAPLRRFDASGFPCTVAAAIDDASDGDRRIVFALAAAREAWQQAGAPPGILGVFIGAEPGRPSWSTLLRIARGEEVPDASRLSPAAVAACLARELRAQGPVETISLACASGAAALIEGARALRRGECDFALCGGVGADVEPLTLAGFGLLGALTARGVSRPFDAHRDGFAVGEGAAMAVLSREPAPVELAGAGRNLDAHHITAPLPDGSGAVRAMRDALAGAGVDAVDVVQAHGTSTRLNDAIEAAALRTVLGESLGAGHVSSVKGALGHTIAAAGALGFLCAVESVAHGIVLPTAGLLHPDPDCALPHVMGAAIERRVRTAMINSFGFGGANCSLVLRRAA
jgi:3-oxoacyl-[acyl-carrier-protein] synthase II